MAKPKYPIRQTGLGKIPHVIRHIRTHVRKLWGEKTNLSWILYPDFYEILLWLAPGRYVISETSYKACPDSKDTKVLNMCNILTC
jgi:hypothetical protein